jgi:hypothetical protein
LLRWLTGRKIQHETETLASIKERVDKGDVSALDEVKISSTGAVELQSTPARPHLPPAVAPTTYKAKSRTEYNAYVRDCEDAFAQSSVYFRPDDKKISFALQYLDHTRKSVWKGHCTDSIQTHGTAWKPTWAVLKERMLQCLGTPLQRQLKAREAIKICQQRSNQTPSELLEYLQPLWDEAEVVDGRQQVADFITAMDPQLKKYLGVTSDLHELTLSKVEEKASNLYQSFGVAKKDHQKPERPNKRKNDEKGDKEEHSDPKKANKGRNGSKRGRPRYGKYQEGIKCFNCNRMGHYAADCRSKPREKTDKDKTKPSDGDKAKNAQGQKD